MNPINFPEANGTLNAPLGMENQVRPLPVFRDDKYCVSLWQLTEEERVAVASGAPIYLSLMSGATQPPCLLTIDPPFASAGCEPEKSLLLDRKG